MKSREDCLKALKAKHPDAGPAELSRMADDEMKKTYAVIKGVEIFATGTHNGDKYTDQDLDDMVAAFGELDVRPAIKIGHTKDAPGAPAYGWVTNLRRSGQKLVADFDSMHDSVVDAVRKKLYDNVSSEIYFNLKRGGKTFRRALKAVALLGAEPPAVADLIPLHKMEFAGQGEYEKMSAGEMKLDVSPQALFDSLNERMTQLIKSFSEDDDMKTRPEQIKELTEKMALLSKQLGEVQGKTDKEKDEIVKKLSEQMTQVQADLKVLSETTDDNDNARERAAAKAREEELNKTIKTLSENTDALRADSRRREVSEKVSQIKVPAFRAAFEAMYSYALLHNAEKVKVYSKDKDGKEVSEDKSLAQITDGLVTMINGQAEKLFKAMAVPGAANRDEGHDEDAGIEVDNRARKLKADGKAKTYEQAIEMTLEADPELKKRYSEQTSARATAH